MYFILTIKDICVVRNYTKSAQSIDRVENTFDKLKIIYTE